jgi:hypothetical protein
MISGMTCFQEPYGGPLAYTNIIVEEPLRLIFWPSTPFAQRYQDLNGYP